MADASNSTDNLPATPDMGEIAIAYGPRDRTRAYIAPDGRLMNEDSVLARYGGGMLDVYEDLLRDDQVKSALDQRRSAVTGANWTVEPASEAAEDVAAAKFLEEQLLAVGWDEVTDKMLYATFYGHSIAELLWTVTPEGKFGWEAIKVRRRQRFAFTASGRPFLDLDTAPEGRIYCDAPYFWHINTGADHSDNPYGLGTAHQLFWPVRFKRDGIRFFLVFLEKFAQPTVVGKFKPGAKPDDKARLLNAVKRVMTEAGVIVPDDMVIELLEASRSGTVDYAAMIRLMDASIQKIIVGQTLTSEVGSTGGNRALGQVHMSVRQDIVKADSDLVCESFNKGPVRWLTRYNFPNAKPPRVLREIEQGADTDQLSQELERLDRMGFRPKLTMVQATWGADMEEKPKPEVPPGLEDQAGRLPFGAPKPEPEFAAALREMFPDQQALDDGMDAFAGRMERIAAATLAPVLAYAADHSPLETLEAINSVMPEWNTDQLTESLTRIMFVGATLGRASAAV